MNGAENLIRTLVGNGVDLCFANPGTSEMHFVAALDRVDGMRCVLGLFEGVVTGAADGYGRMLDRPAATLLHLGPGLANGLSNLHNASRAYSPVVNIIGDHATYHRHLDAPLTSDIEGAARPFSHWVRTSPNADTVAADGAAAIAAALAPPGRVASLILPADTAWTEVKDPAPDGIAPMPAISPREKPSSAAIDAAAEMLSSGETTALVLAGPATRERTLDLAGRIAAVTGAKLFAQTHSARITRGAGRVPVTRIPYPPAQALDTFKPIKNIILIGGNSRRALLFGGVGRLKPGVTLEQAQANLKAIAEQLARAYPDDNGGRSVALVPLAQSTINPGFRQNIVRVGGLLMTVVGLVLLIACANVANLLLARATARQREIAVRLSLGSSRGRLVRQLLTEGLLLALLAGALGLLIAYWAQGALWAMRPPGLAADAIDLTPGSRVLAFTALVSVLTAVVFGLAPAISASRPDLVAELKQRAGGTAGSNRVWSLRNLLVAGQVALSLVALVGAGLFVKSLGHAQRIAPGFDHERLAVLTVDLGAQGYDEARGREFHRRMLGRARALPGVERATLASGIPLFQGGFLRTVFTEGVDASDRRNGRLVQLNTVEPGYLETMGIPLLRGRDLGEEDHADAPHVVVVNETMARQFWPDQDPLGKRFKFFGQDFWNQVVGVARDGKYNFLGEDPQPHIYVSLRQTYEPAVSLHVRSAADPSAALGMARQEVQALDRTLPITNVFTFAAIFDQNLWAPRLGAYLLGVFGLLSLLLAVIGIYGVMSYSVGQRTRELGVRMALGAGQADVLRLVVGQAVLLALVGIVVGLGLSFLATRLVANLLFDVSAHDPWTFAAIPVLLAASAGVASLKPAWRATRVDPTVALRAE